MKILVLNGSPRPQGNTAAMAAAFEEGAKSAGHEVTIINVAKAKVAGCLGCEYCHGKGEGKCVQQDGMQEVYQALADAEMLVLASPVYYFTMSAQMQATIHRTYAIGTPPKLKKIAMLLSSGSEGVYDACVSQYKAIVDYWQAEDMGIITAHGKENKSEEKLSQVREFCKNL